MKTKNLLIAISLIVSCQLSVINCFAQVIATITSTNVTCNGMANGTATVTASGGVQPYSYLWSNTGNTTSITGLSANNYTVIVTDANSAKDTAFITITQPTVLTTSITTTAASCGMSDGSATITVSGGTPPYTYLWNNSQSTPTASALTAGNYSCTVTDANGCPQITNAIIVNPNGPTVTISSQTNVSCFGGSDGTAVVFATGGQPSYTYQWNTVPVQTTTTATGLTAGNYTVSVTDFNGCTNSTTVTIAQPTAITISISGNTAICAGTSANITGIVNGGSGGYTYLWSPGGQTVPNISVSPAGNTLYTLNITDATGCTASDSVLVVVNASPTANAGTDQTICLGATIYFSGTVSGAPTYLWNFGDGNTSSILTPSHTYSSAGTFYVSFAVSSVTSGCSATDTMNAIVNSIPFVFITPPSQTICTGSSTQLMATGATTYLWSPSIGLSCTTCPNPIASPSIATAYNVQGISNGCAANDSTHISLIPGQSISGHVDSAGFNFLNGEVVIYKYIASQTRFDSIQAVSIGTGGNYFFSSINYGKYLIKVFPNTAMHPTAMPTYFGNQFLWTAADSINHDCYTNDTANISVLFQQIIPLGPGALGGLVEEGVGFGRQEGDPIPGLDVKLGKNPGGANNIVATTQTDANGYYYFANLALNSVIGGSYTIYADIPGLGMASSYTITLDPSNPTYDSLNYAVDSTSIYTVLTSSTGISNPEIAKENKFKVYPNPFKGNTSIEYNISNEADVTLEVYNVLGVKIKSLVNSKQFAGNHKCNLSNQNTNLSSGVYFITLTIDGKASTQRIVVME